MTYVINCGVTPEEVTALKPNQVFVFGSNLAGQHGGGAARYAYKHFGAKMGVGVGPQGQSYAIPTMQGGVATIKTYVDQFIAYARQNPQLHFLVTKIGCGIAGFPTKAISPLFAQALELANVSLPREFIYDLRKLHHCISPQEYTCQQQAQKGQAYTHAIPPMALDKIQGSLMLGAAGDALGYAVEFNTLAWIRSQYGKDGITHFQLDSQGRAICSDDTQMTLFTANGLLSAITRGETRGVMGPLESYLPYAYLDWYYTQTGKLNSNILKFTWLRDLEPMRHQRAPGNTCLSACDSLLLGQKVQNNSKGCGGLMRIAPVPLLYNRINSKGDQNFIHQMEKTACEAARITHRHPLGFLPAGLMARVIYEAMNIPAGMSHLYYMDSSVINALNDLQYMYPGEYGEAKAKLAQLTKQAIVLAKSKTPDAEAIAQLGEGWVADEAWAIAIFCAVRYQNNPALAIRAAVNHNGDSDSTGSICGNIIGALLGYDATRHLFCPEGRDLGDTLDLGCIILAIATDLASGCPLGNSPRPTPYQQLWHSRYCQMKPE